MRQLLRLTLVGALLVLGPAVRPAFAVSIEDLVNLKANGVSDAILVALIETDGSVFHLTAADVLALSRRGLSDDVILAMVKTAKTRPQAAPAAPVDAVETEQAVPAPAAPVVHVTQSVVQTVEIPRETTQTIAVPVAVPVFVPRHEPPKKAEPVYWGYGGQRRPDTWQDPPDSRGKPDGPAKSGTSTATPTTSAGAAPIKKGS